MKHSRSIFLRFLRPSLCDARVKLSPGSSVQSQNRLGICKKQVVPSTPRHELDLWVSLTLVGFKNEWKPAIAFHDARSLSARSWVTGRSDGLPMCTRWKQQTIDEENLCLHNSSWFRLGPPKSASIRLDFGKLAALFSSMALGDNAAQGIARESHRGLPLRTEVGARFRGRSFADSVLILICRGQETNRHRQSSCLNHRGSKLSPQETYTPWWKPAIRGRRNVAIT